MLLKRSWHAVLPVSLTQASIGNSTGIKFPSTSSCSRFHAAGEGQFASDGRRRRNPVVAAAGAGSFPDPHSVRAHNGRSHAGLRAAIPDRLKNVLLSI